MDLEYLYFLLGFPVLWSVFPRVHQSIKLCLFVIKGNQLRSGALCFGFQYWAFETMIWKVLCFWLVVQEHSTSSRDIPDSTAAMKQRQKRKDLSPRNSFKGSGLNFLPPVPTSSRFWGLPIALWVENHASLPGSLGNTSQNHNTNLRFQGLRFSFLKCEGNLGSRL